MFTLQPDLSENVQKHLNRIDNWGWNPFHINELTCNRSLHFTMVKLWQRSGVTWHLKNHIKMHLFWVNGNKWAPGMSFLMPFFRRGASFWQFFRAFVVVPFLTTFFPVVIDFDTLFWQKSQIVFHGCLFWTKIGNFVPKMPFLWHGHFFWHGAFFDRNFKTYRKKGIPGVQNLQFGLYKFL